MLEQVLGEVEEAMNNCKIEIYENKQWVDYTKYIIASFKFANLLDEQLDEATITLKRVLDKAYFKPMTRIRVVATNSPKARYSQEMADKIRLESDLKFSLIDGEYKSYDKRTTFYYDTNTKRITQISIKEFLLANDTSIENPVGSNKYDHEIYLIEQTKYLERFIGDSITFTNALGKSYEDTDKLENYISGFPSGDSPPTETKKFVKETYLRNSIEFPLYDIIANFEYLNWNFFYKGDTDALYRSYALTIQVKRNGKIIATERIKKEFDPKKEIWICYDSNGSVTTSNFIFTPPSMAGYELKYIFEYFNSGALIKKAEMLYVFGIIENMLPLKKWTITDVCNRIFDTVEPLVKDINFKNVKPRFRLQGVLYDELGEITRYSENSLYEPNSQAEKYDKIIAPEFTFAQMTLREMLSMVGGFIHAEPRITQKIETESDECWEIAFDEYGINEISNISKKRYISAGYKTNINDYCTSLDSSAQNLVNMLDYAQGVTFEPFYCNEKNSGKGISLRTENTTMRTSDDESSFIPTSYNVYMFNGAKQVRITYIPGIGESDWDITPYIFEKADYDGSLDSFAGVYPYSKSYALYYTQGSKNIYGLFFKAPHRSSSALEDYTILKIIRAVTGRSNLELSLEQLRNVRFCVSYLPISNARIKTAKQIILGGLPSTIAYNQSANNIETSYYGENLKGVVERLGNVEKTYTYHLAFMSEVPKVGIKFDNNYYISSVSTEILPLYIRCTIGLSKDFNRLSEYVGISSNKRMWEISEKMSQERQSVFTEYLVIKRNFTHYGGNIKGHWNKPIVPSLFYSSNLGLISLVEVLAKDKKGNNISTICLPVISLALGNSILFTFSFKDNYSAGQRIESDGFSNYVSYTDFYGRIYYLDMNFIDGQPRFIEDNESVGKNFPLVDLNDNVEKTININNYKYRKDSREYPQITYELCAVSEDNSLIIGSALMKNCQFVNRNPVRNTYRVYGLTDRLLNKFENKVDLTNAVFIANLSNENIKNSEIILPKYEGNKTFKSWVIVTPNYDKTEEVEDEDGNVFEQVLSSGFDLILGCNGDYVSEEHIGFVVQEIRDIYDI